MKKLTSSGFTLIEVMIVVAIIAILTSIAYPAYTEAIRKGKRAEGRAALAELMQQQERYMTQNNCYMGFTSPGGVAAALSPGAACGGVTPTTVPFKVFSGDNTAKAAYFLSASACTGTTIADCVMLSATPNHNDPDYLVLQMSSTGTKSCTGPKNLTSECWK